MAQVNKTNPITRLELFLDILRDRSQSLMTPGRHVAVDEALVLWKGRLRFRKFIKTKRARFGVKMFFCPSDKTFSGYSWNFKIYYGRDDYPIADPAAMDLSISERIVVFLMNDLLDTGRHVVTDNWYTSLRLANYLETRLTMLTGIVRYGRGPPRELQDGKAPKKSMLLCAEGECISCEIAG